MFLPYLWIRVSNGLLDSNATSAPPESAAWVWKYLLGGAEPLGLLLEKFVLLSKTIEPRELNTLRP